MCALACGEKPRKKVSVKSKGNMTTDFRKADPTYTSFKPCTAEEAINKFYRHKNLGVPPHLWPEIFVQCAASLPDAELQKFEMWLVCPQGEPTGTELKQIDVENEKLRLQLLKEAEARDTPMLHVVQEEQDDEKMPQPMSTDEEKFDDTLSASMTTHCSLDETYIGVTLT